MSETETDSGGGLTCAELGWPCDECSNMSCENLPLEQWHAIDRQIREAGGLMK